MIQPALTTLHPDKEQRPIVAGETWTKKASGKCSNKRPQVRIIDQSSTGLRLVRFRDCYDIAWRKSERVFRRDYE